jgi:hypothetical protein
MCILVVHFSLENKLNDGRKILFLETVLLAISFSCCELLLLTEGALFFLRKRSCYNLALLSLALPFKYFVV